MKTPEERTIDFVSKAISIATSEFNNIEWDRRRGSYQSGVQVIEVRVFEEAMDPNSRPFDPIAIIYVVNPDNPKMQVRTLNAKGEIVEKDFSPAEFTTGLEAQLNGARSPSKKEDAKHGTVDWHHMSERQTTAPKTNARMRTNELIANELEEIEGKNEN